MASALGSCICACRRSRPGPRTLRLRGSLESAGEDIRCVVFWTNESSALLEIMKKCFREQHRDASMLDES